MNLLFRRRGLILPLLASLLAPPGIAQAQSGSGSSSPDNPCSSAFQTGVPAASLANGVIHALIYLPDAQKGYYRSSRFDWAGVIPCLSYKGHTYFGAWSPHHDPLVVDSITGPVEEFRSADGGLGYAQAGPGGLFVKPGVGVLRKVDSSAYRYMFPYPVVDPGKWTIQARPRSIAFTQKLHSSIGYAYVYTKVLRLDQGKPVLLIEHHMRNTGARTIDTDVYDHDFFMLDNQPTGPGMAIHFAFVPIPATPLQHGAQVEGHDIVYHDELQEQQTVTSFLTGYSANRSDYDFTVENRSTGVGVEQSADAPLSNFNLWSIRTTLCPEAYVHLHIAPGQTQSWTIRYRFFGK